MPFKRDLALQNTPLSKQPFTTQPEIEYEDVTWRAQHNATHHKNQQAYGTLTTRTLVRWLNLNSSHCTENMYRIIDAQV